MDRAQLIELYRQHFLTIASSQPLLDICVQRAKLSPAMLEAADRIVQYAVQVIDLTKKVPDIDVRLNKARSEYADSSPQVTTIRAEQRAVMEQARKLHTDMTTAFGQAFEVYLNSLKNERPTNPRMTAFRQGVLLPTVAWLNWLASREDNEYDAASWQRFLMQRWDVVTLNGHMKSVEGVAFSPDSSRIASASDDNTVKIWDAATGKVLATLSGHTSSVSGVAFSPDGSRVASASSDNTVKIWDLVEVVTRWSASKNQ